MSIEQRKVVDFISTRGQGGRIILTISDHRPWTSGTNHVQALQDKINDYLAFIESGEVYDSYPRAHGQEIEIQIVCKYPPEGEGVRFLKLAGDSVRGAGFHFSTRMSENEPNDGEG